MPSPEKVLTTEELEELRFIESHSIPDPEPQEKEVPSSSCGAAGSARVAAEAAPSTKFLLHIITIYINTYVHIATVMLPYGSNCSLGYCSVFQLGFSINDHCMYMVLVRYTRSLQ